MAENAENKEDASVATKAAETYYDSSDADEFYFHVWGGEDIHVGLYEDGLSIKEASERTVGALMEELGELTADDHVLDLGAGYGGAARRLNRRFGCKVTCLNVSETQNARNREMNEAGGYDGVDVVYGNFEQLPFPDETFTVAWSQDAFLHSGRRMKVIGEVARVLKPGGRLVFTDPMQNPNAPADIMAPILSRIHLSDLASFDFYREAAKEHGLEVVAMHDLSPQLPRHYGQVRKDLESRRDEIEKLASKAYVERMLEGLGHWVNAGDAGHLAWGIMVLRKPE